jgi:predicted DNA-binding protein
MNATSITLTEGDREFLHDLARQTGKAEDELVREALQFLREEVSRRRESRLEKLRQARGMWKARDDLPTVRDLREEWDQRTLHPGADAS